MSQLFIGRRENRRGNGIVEVSCSLKGPKEIYLEFIKEPNLQRQDVLCDSKLLKMFVLDEMLYQKKLLQNMIDADSQLEDATDNPSATLKDTEDLNEVRLFTYVLLIICTKDVLEVVICSTSTYQAS